MVQTLPIWSLPMNECNGLNDEAARAEFAELGQAECGCGQLPVIRPFAAESTPALCRYSGAAGFTAAPAVAVGRRRRRRRRRQINLISSAQMKAADFIITKRSRFNASIDHSAVSNHGQVGGARRAGRGRGMGVSRCPLKGSWMQTSCWLSNGSFFNNINFFKVLIGLLTKQSAMTIN